MHVELIGTGPQDVLLLHYFGGSGRYWKAMIDALPRDQFRFIIPDLPGFGRSADYLPLSAVPEKAAALRGLLERLRVKNCLIAGHSMGGKIAMALAAAAPGTVSGLLLLAPSPPSPEPISFSDRKLLHDMYGRKPELRQHLVSICEATLQEDTLNELLQANCDAAQAAWNSWLDVGSREDITGSIGSIDVPIRVCYGTGDALITGPLLEATVCSRFSRTSLTRIDGCGHLLPVEKPAAVAAELLALIQELNTTR